MTLQMSENKKMDLGFAEKHLLIKEETPTSIKK